MGKKEYQAYDFYLVNCVTLEAEGRKHNGK
jgi:hypothetical protein